MADLQLLTIELQYYRTRQIELKNTHPGQFAIIRGQELVGIFRTAVQAYAVGVHRFPFGAYLVKEIMVGPMAGIPSGLVDAEQGDLDHLTVERDALAVLLERKTKQSGARQRE